MSKNINVKNEEKTKEVSTDTDIKTTDDEKTTDTVDEKKEIDVNKENIDETKEVSVDDNSSDNDNKDIDDNVEIKEEYIVVYPFLDLKDGNYEYKVNSKYPREDISDDKKEIALSQERINQLTTSNNRIGKILISKIEN